MVTLSNAPHPRPGFRSQIRPARPCFYGRWFEVRFRFHGAQRRAMAGVGYRPCGVGLIDGLAFLRIPFTQALERPCAVLKTWPIRRFLIFRPMNPGLSPLRFVVAVPQPLCNRAAFLRKTLHVVKLTIGCAAPRPAWAGALFALQPGLHKKSAQSPSAGGG